MRRSLARGAPSSPRPQQPQRLTCDGRVVERKNLLADDLVGLMPLAGDEHDVAGFRVCNGALNRQAAIEHYAVLDPIRDAAEHVVDDRTWFFATWIIGGQVDPIGELRGNGSHLGALSPIAVATTAEDDRNRTLGLPCQRSDCI